jgi:hypothetical protein
MVHLEGNEAGPPFGVVALEQLVEARPLAERADDEARAMRVAAGRLDAIRGDVQRAAGL